MRILLVFPESYMNPRMGIMYLASILKAQGHEVRFANAGRVGLKGLRNTISEWKPAIVGYTAITGEHVRLVEFNRALKRDLSFMAVFGGPHATFCPEDLLADPACDAACVGEADEAFPEFCRRVESGGPWWETPNFAVRRDGQILRNPLIPRVADLDSLPMPDHDLMYEADPALATESVKYFQSNRGCPCVCTYCFHAAFNKMYRGMGPNVRERSPEKFIDEICYVRERYPLTHIVMDEDSFFLNSPEWFERFCVDYKARVDLPFMCCVRADQVTEERVAQLRAVGLIVIIMAIECGDETIANTLLNRHLTNDRIREAAALVKRHGVFLVTANMCGLPVPDPFKADLETLALNVEIGTDWARCALLCPYPGTAIRNYAIDAGLIPEGHIPVFDTNKRHSAFTFASPMEKRKVENLSMLLDVFLHHPWLRKHAEFLCALPLGWFYGAASYVRFGYIWKFKQFPFTSIWTEIWKFFPILFKLLRTS